jgi:monoamine oxidase
VTRLTRRGFLRLAAAAPLAATLAGCGGGDGGPVLVIGGGLCGLVALDRLARAGRKAVLLEAGNRLGGRILTLREGFAAGLRAEMGAERVGLEDHGVRALLKELGVATAAHRPPSNPMIFQWQGRSYRFHDVRDLPAALLEGLSDAERQASPLGILHGLMEGAPAPAADDARSGMEWMRSRGLTPAGEKFVRAFVPMPLDGPAAPVFFRMATREVKARKSDLVAGGTDQIVEKLAARHAAAITKGVQIVSLRQEARRVEAADASGRKFDGSSAIVCLPLNPLRKLTFEGGVPEPLATRLKDLEPAYERKTAAESDKAETEYVFAERSVLWRLPEMSAKGTFVTHRLDWEADAKPAASDGGAARAAAGSAFRDFTFDPLVGGAYAYSKSGAAREGVVVAGRLLFAGADLSDMPGWMEGAVRAAEQAVAALPG